MGQRHTISFSFAPRVATEHLGRQKYTTPGRALGELIANAFDAQATSVEIVIEYNELGVEERLVVSDNGVGMSLDTIRQRFAVVGIPPQATRDDHFGRFGVGRLAVHRIGSTSDWETIARDPDLGLVRSTFTLDIDQPEKVTVTTEGISGGQGTGTSVRIENLNDSGRQSLSPSRLSSDLLTQFCSYLLATKDREIRINDEALRVQELVARETTEEFALRDEPSSAVLVRHLVLEIPTTRSRFDGQLLYTAKGRTVQTEEPEVGLLPNYLAVVQCDYLDSIVAANREALIEFDGRFADLRIAVLERVATFQEQLQGERSRRFIEAARERSYYPYKGSPSDAVAAASQALYDVVLERVHEHANLERMTQAQQAVVFRLLRRAVGNEDLLDILEEVACLSDQDLEQFRKVLEKTTLQSIIRLSTEVSNRLGFLKLLDQFVYGEPSKFLRERSELHRILEPYCWIFGERFNLATSDQSFRSIIAAHRDKAGLPTLEVEEIDGLDQIPDLFLASERDYGSHQPSEHLLVEIKAPKVKIGVNEVSQIRRYANVIRESPQFDHDRVSWHIFAVSSDLTKQIEEDRSQEGRTPGILYQWSNMTVWVFRWSEIIKKSKEELNLVSQHLEQKSNELSVSKFLQENFPEILEGLVERVGSSGLEPGPRPESHWR